MSMAYIRHQISVAHCHKGYSLQLFAGNMISAQSDKREDGVPRIEKPMVDETVRHEVRRFIPLS